MNKITPLVKGFITGIIMLATTLLLIYTKQPADSGLRYIVYALYAGGIAWTLIDYSRSDTYSGKFGDIFGQGFRCFIIVTLIMVIFTAVFSLTHPEIAEEAAKQFKADLSWQKNKTPAEIEKTIETAKKQFTTRQISLAIFGTLITGALFTAVGAGFLIMRRK